MLHGRTRLRSIVLLLGLSAGLVGLGPAPAPARPASSEPGAISGTITGPDGAPLEGATVSAYPVKCDQGCDAYAAVSGADGTYEVTGVPAAAYHLLFQVGNGWLAEFYDNVVDQDAATKVV